VLAESSVSAPYLLRRSSDGTHAPGHHRVSSYRLPQHRPAQDGAERPLDPGHGEFPTIATIALGELVVSESLAASRRPPVAAARTGRAKPAAVVDPVPRLLDRAAYPAATPRVSSTLVDS